MRQGSSGHGDDGIVQRAVDAASEVLSLEELADSFVPLLQEAVGGTHALLFDWADDGRPVGIAGSLAPHLATYSATLYGGDPLLSGMRVAEPGLRPILVEDVVDYRTLRASAAYQEFYRPLGVERLVGLWATRRRFGDPGAVGLMIARPPDDRPFGDWEQGLLQRTLPAFRAAVVRDRRAREAQREREIVELALRHLAPQPTFVFDRHGELLWASPDADDLLREDAAGGPILVRLLAEAARRVAVAVAAHEAPEDAAPRSVALRVGEGTRDVRLSVAALSSGSLAVIAAVRDDRATSRRLHASARRLGLSKAEAGVFECLAEGLDNRAIAARLFVSEPTVKTHVRQILTKLRVESRTQAALVAHSLLPRRLEELGAPNRRRR